jgi:hypothetical protein
MGYQGSEEKGDTQDIRQNLREVQPMIIKKEYAILAVVILALVGYLFVKQTNRLHYTLPTVPVITKNSIMRLELRKGNQQINLIKKEGVWFISPEEYPADAARMDRITGAITDFTLDTLASESKDYLRYDLTEDKKIAVQVFGEKGPVFSFAIGKRAATNRHTFVQIQGDARVFQAQGNFRSDFELGKQEFRDKNVLSFVRDTLESITFTEDGRTLELKKTTAEKAGGVQETKATGTGATPVTGWVDTTGREIAETAMNGLFSQLTEFQCESYLEGKKKEDFKDPILTIALQGEKGATLTIFEKNNQNEKINPAISSGNNYPFFIQTYKIEMIRKALKEIRGDRNEAQAGRQNE